MGENEISGYAMVTIAIRVPIYLWSYDGFEEPITTVAQAAAFEEQAIRDGAYSVEELITGDNATVTCVPCE